MCHCHRSLIQPCASFNISNHSSDWGIHVYIHQPSIDHFTYTFYLSEISHLPAYQIGYIMLIYPVIIVFAGPIAGALSDQSVQSALSPSISL